MKEVFGDSHTLKQKPALFFKNTTKTLHEFVHGVLNLKNMGVTEKKMQQKEWTIQKQLLNSDGPRNTTEEDRFRSALKTLEIHVIRVKAIK